MSDLFKPEVYCPKEKRRIPCWHCVGSFVQQKMSCEDLREITINIFENWAKVNCFKRVSFRVRREYFHQIVTGIKKEEIRADIPAWQWLLDPERAPKAAVFLCGRRVHRRMITRIYKEHPHIVLGRQVSPKGVKDLRLPSADPEHSRSCIILELGEAFEEG